MISTRCSPSAHLRIVSSKMKCFVSVNPNSPKKRRRKRLITYEEAISFGPGPALGLDLDSRSGRSVHTPDENQPWPMLDSPWTPLPRFKAWESSRLTGSDPLTAQDCQILNGSPLASTPSESPLEPVLLKLRNPGSNLGQTLEASQPHAYETPSLSQSVWGECKRTVLKAIVDANRSLLDLILDILDPSLDEYEHYRLRWFSSSCSILSRLLDSIFAHPKGRDFMLDWMHPHSLKSVCSTVMSEIVTPLGLSCWHASLVVLIFCHI